MDGGSSADFSATGDIGAGVAAVAVNSTGTGVGGACGFVSIGGLACGGVTCGVGATSIGVGPVSYTHLIVR